MKTFPTLHSYVTPSPPSTPNTSWKFIGLFVKQTGVMSIKCRRSVGSTLYYKMRTKAVCHFKKIITKGMTYTQAATKPISLFNSYDHLNFPFVLHSLNLTGYPIPMFSILVLKFQLKSKLRKNFNVIQKIW